MDGHAAATEAMEGFLAGRLAFDGLADALSAQPANAVAAIVDDAVNLGRLPPDVAELLRVRIAAAAVSRAATPAADPLDALRSRVDEVVTEALVDDFRRFRDRPRTPKTVEERQLDVLLTEFRGLRLRRQAGRIGTAGAVPTGAAMRLEEAPPLAPGDMLKDRFVLDEVLGRGGMGQVFRAVDRRRLEALDPQPYVALKLIAGDFRRHPDALRAIEAEARRAQALAHPNICAVFDFDRDGAHAFIVMELLEGETLDEALRAAPDHRLAPARCVAVLGGLLAAIAHAHAHGVVHADLKPGNIFLAADGTTKVLDFGVATALSGAGFDPTSLRALTPGYSSPEMAGDAPRDPRDDVFALGAIAYLVLSGRHPFDRRAAEQALALGLVPEPVAGLPEAATNAIAAALAFDRNARPADAGAFAAALMPALAG